MEVLLLLWDEFDDFAATCRHMATSAAEEVVTVTTLSGPLLAAGSSLLCVLLTAPTLI